MGKVKVAVLGATGIVGQAFAWMLSKHELFDLVYLSASSPRKNKRYGDEVNWVLPYEIPSKIRKQNLEELDYGRLKKHGVKIVFSALPTDTAGKVEPELRDAGYLVFSNAGANRYDDDVPILIPEINIESIKLIEKQGYPDNGFIVTNANCSVTGLSLALAPLVKFGIVEVYVSTYQSISGAGYPGISALDILGNIMPFIENEESKIKKEVRKILGAKINVYPHCLRVPVVFGHHETVWIKFQMSVTEADIINAWNSFRMKDHKISTMPKTPVKYIDKDAFPQSRMCFNGKPPGMTVYVGKLKNDNNRFGFKLMVNNLIRGAAGGSIENAEVFLSEYGARK